MGYPVTSSCNIQGVFPYKEYTETGEGLCSIWDAEIGIFLGTCKSKITYFFVKIPEKLLSAIYLKPTLPTKPTTTCKRQRWQPKLSALGQAENRVTYSYNRTHRSHTGRATVLTDCALLPQERLMLIKVKKKKYGEEPTYLTATVIARCILTSWRVFYDHAILILHPKTLTPWHG